jgi:3-(3-hydroxy-phenyl)propionate hydroxylase
MAHVAVRRVDERSKALGEYVDEMLSMEGPRKRMATEMAGLDVRYGLGDSHPLVGRRVPDLDLVTPGGSRRVYTLLHDARPVLLNLGEAGSVDITPWSDRVKLIDAKYAGLWEVPVIGVIAAPAAVLIRPDGHVAWAGNTADSRLAEALTAWFGPPRCNS